MRGGKPHVTGMMHGEAHTIRDVYVDGPLERRSFGGERDSMDAHQRRLRLDFEQLVLLSVADHRFQRLVHAIRANVESRSNIV